MIRVIWTRCISPCLMFLCLLLLPLSLFAATLSVPTDYPTIQAAIDASQDGDTIIVQPGTYQETISFKGKAITLTSTNPKDPSIVASTIIDGNNQGSVVTFSSGETQDATLTGFTIQHGTGTLIDGKRYGGGIYCGDNSSATIRYSKIINNSADVGGGVYLHGNPPPTIEGPTASYPYAAPGQSVTLSVTASDPDDDTLTYTWTSGSTTIGSGPSVSFSSNTPGVYPIKVTVTEGHGGKVEGTVSVTVIGITIQALPQLLVGQPATLTATLTPSLADSPQYPVTITWSLLQGTGSFDANMNGTVQAKTITFTPSASGPGTVKVVYAVGSVSTSHQRAFSLNPVVSTIQPTIAFQGETIDATITGNNLGRVTAVSTGSGVVATILAGKTETTLPVRLVIAETATAGNRSLTLTTPEGTFISSLTFQVKALPPITPNVSSLSLITGTNGTITFSIPSPASAGGLTLTLTSSYPSVAAVPASVAIPEGQHSVVVDVTPLGYGTTTITASVSGYAKGQVNVSVTSSTAPQSEIDSYTKLLLHGEGANGSIIIKDSSLPPKTVARYGTVSITTADSVFGGSSIRFMGGSSDYASFPSSVLAFGTEDFTVEFWIKVETNLYSGQWPYVLVSGPWNSGTGFYIVIDGSNTGWGGTGVLSFNGATTLPNRPSGLVTKTIIRNAGWKHIAITRQDVTTRLFVNGVLEASHIAPAVVNYGASAAYLFSPTELYSTCHEKAYLDEFRVSKGIARWTSDFIPPGGAYTYLPTTIASPRRSIFSSSPQTVTLTCHNGGLGCGNIYYTTDGSIPTTSSSVYSSPITISTNTILRFFAQDLQGNDEVPKSETYTFESVPGIDPYTNLLLHMDGINGSTTFNDSSQSPKILSVVGNAKIDTSQSKFGGSSAKFNGNGDYLSTADSTDWYLGTGDFTIDCWARFSSLPADGSIMLLSQQMSSNGSTNYDFRIDRSDTTYYLLFRLYNPGTGVNTWVSVPMNSPPVTNTWYHFAVCRQGTNWYFFKDGIQQGTVQVNANSVEDLDRGITIGGAGGGWTGYSFIGWIDEFRWSKGIARWTSNFTPPTGPYTAIANRGIDQYTMLLVKGDGPDGSTVFYDASGIKGSKTVAANGNARITTAQSKFGGSSSRFDGYLDHLSVPASSDWSFGSEDLTIDFWVRFNTLPSSSKIMNAMVARYNSETNWWQCRMVYKGDGAWTPRFEFHDGSTTHRVMGAGESYSTGVWYHFAYVRSNGIWNIYVNGASVGYAEDSTPIQTVSSPLYVGNSDVSGPWCLDGWLDEVRISKGVARWTSNFTPPTSEYQTDSYTKLLLRFNGLDGSTAFVDDSRSNSTFRTLTSIGNTQVDTAQSRFGGGSILLDGIGDYITVPASSDWLFGTEDFTIDAWVRFDSLAATSPNGHTIVGQLISDNNFWRLFLRCATPTSWGMHFIGIAGGSIVFEILESPTSYSTGVWYHFAAVRNGNTITLYKNGISIGATTLVGSFPSSNADLSLGTYSTNDGVGMNGWIDEFRISKGIARWTASFMPPTYPYTGKVEDEKDVLMLHFDGDNASKAMLDECGHAVTASGDAHIDSAQSKFGGASAFFDGNGDYLTVPDSGDWDLGSGDFTIDFWMNVAAFSGANFNRGVFSKSRSNGNRGYIAYIPPNEQYITVYFWGNDSTIAAVLSSQPIALNTWYHIAVARSGSRFTLYVNGVASATATYSSAIQNPMEPLKIGTLYEPTITNSYFNGWIDDFRISKGVARWTSNFTPPIAPYGGQ